MDLSVYETNRLKTLKEEFRCEILSYLKLYAPDILPFANDIFLKIIIPILEPPKQSKNNFKYFLKILNTPRLFLGIEGETSHNIWLHTFFYLTTKLQRQAEKDNLQDWFNPCLARTHYRIVASNN